MFLVSFDKFKSKEIFERTSLFGIHREDIGFFINGNRVREFASQGQQRTVILILRLCQAEYIKEINITTEKITKRFDSINSVDVGLLEYKEEEDI